MLQPMHKKNNYTLFSGWFDCGENSNAMVEDRIPQCSNKQVKLNVVVVRNSAKQIPSTIYCLERVCVCVLCCVFFFFSPLLSLSPSSSLKHGLLWSLNYVRCQKAYFIPVLVDSVKTCVSKQRA